VTDGRETPSDDAQEAKNPAWARARAMFAAAAGTVALGLAIAGTGDRNVGGAVLLAGWGLTVLALHRLGRAGSAGPLPPHLARRGPSDLAAQHDDAEVRRETR
jgi:hypothetical protein